MSQEDVELVLETLRSFESSDFEGATPLWHQDCRVTGPAGWPEPGPFVGRAAAVGQFRRLAADWGETRIANVDFIADRAGWIVLAFRWEARGEKSGVGTALDFAAAYRVEDRQISEAHFRWTRDEALEAAGLSE